MLRYIFFLELMQLLIIETERSFHELYVSLFSYKSKAYNWRNHCRLAYLGSGLLATYEANFQYQFSCLLYSWR